MTATEDFFRKKVAGSESTGSTATDEFLRKKKEEQMKVNPPEEISTTQVKTEEVDLGNPLKGSKTPIIPQINELSTQDTAMIGE